MAQEYSRVQGFYLQLHEQPAPPLYHQYDLHQANSSAVPAAYELTGDGGGCADAPGNLVAAHALQPPLPLAAPLPHDQRKRKYEHFNADQYEMPATSTSNVSRKSKPSSYGSSSTYQDDGGEDSGASPTLPDRKQNHSEIEKRRRDKMNNYISELSSMIPICGAMARKLDKLTVLRMAVQHLRTVRGALTAGPLTTRPRPAFLSEKELNALILQTAQDCFLLVVGCDRGRLLYVSASVKKMLHFDQSELLGQSLFDILHPKDVAKVKEQLSSSDLSPRERLIDIKTMLPVKAEVVTGASRICPGARRSFFCRIKCRSPPVSSGGASVPVKKESEPIRKLTKKQSNEKKYCVVQCTGYLKSWAPADVTDGGGSTSEGAEETETCNLSCLVAVGRALTDIVPTSGATMLIPPRMPLQFVSRHAIDGKFLFVDQRVTLALGFLPQELLGTSVYEYVHGAELGSVALTHKQALLRREPLHTPAYNFRRKDGSLALIQTHFKPFRNPWTKDVECLVANNTVVTETHMPQQEDLNQSPFDAFKQTGLNNSCEATRFFSLLPSLADDPSDFSGISETDVEMQRLIDSQVESHKIGSAIAEEALKLSSIEFSPDLTTDLLQDVVFNQQVSLVDAINSDMELYNQILNNVPLSAAAGQNSPPTDQTGEMLPPSTPSSESPPLSSLGLDGNGEAAMAVIMSLLEADAGLGGPINFSGLPWPLP